MTKDYTSYTIDDLIDKARQYINKEEKVVTDKNNKIRQNIDENNENAVERLNKTVNKTIEKVEDARSKLHKAHRYTRKIYKTQSNRALFSQETIDRIFNQKDTFKID